MIVLVDFRDIEEQRLLRTGSHCLVYYLYLVERIVFVSIYSIICLCVVRVGFNAWCKSQE